MTAHPTALAVLLEDRGLNRYGSFCAAYQKAAGALDKHLAHSVPSRAQFHRWLTGELRSLPYTDHCRVLEHMLPGYSAPQLFAPLPRADRPRSRACRARSHSGGIASGSRCGHGRSGRCVREQERVHWPG